MVGNTVVPTTVISRARCPSTETGRAQPIRARAWRGVRVPRAISGLVLGSRPVTGAGTKDEPLAGSTSMSASAGPIWTGPPDLTVVQAATWGSRRAAATTGPTLTESVLLTATSHVTP